MIDRAFSAANASTSGLTHAEPVRLARSRPLHVLANGNFSRQCTFCCTQSRKDRKMISQRRPSHVCYTYPTPETEKERSSVDYPQEWTTPPPSRRPDPLPEFEKLETPPPRKMPGDPEQPDEEEEEEKKKEKPEEDPEEQPEAPPAEE